MAEDVARGGGGEDGGSHGGQHPEHETAGDLLAEAGVDVAELGPLQRVRAVQRDHARLRRLHRRRERRVRARLRPQAQSERRMPELACVCETLGAAVPCSQHSETRACLDAEIFGKIIL